jgi:hypothetical protein
MLSVNAIAGLPRGDGFPRGFRVVDNNVPNTNSGEAFFIIALESSHTRSYFPSSIRWTMSLPAMNTSTLCASVPAVPGGSGFGASVETRRLQPDSASARTNGRSMAFFMRGAVPVRMAGDGFSVERITRPGCP